MIYPDLLSVTEMFSAPAADDEVFPKKDQYLALGVVQ